MVDDYPIIVEYNKCVDSDEQLCGFCAYRIADGFEALAIEVAFVSCHTVSELRHVARTAHKLRSS